ncbi:NosD domain-containing protein [Methanolobus mangrovi]|uniref:NosD domain-containing protein n=1 Tax=Methanolobus mangrovi TaxID=3072977 RepID=A0AA51UGR9_9EURY|nr:NosD domain-containing protein [Methanolobus mangrovi]WMW22977.1 NosD domain-containing protein [Methanolobus mangrovi]
MGVDIMIAIRGKFVMALFLFLLIVNISAAATITVDDDPGKDYTTIQEAINAANDTDTILVYPGTYIENVMVNRSVSITSQSGNPDDTIVEAADGFDNAFNVTIGDVLIMGFNITGVDVGPSCGVYVSDVENVRIVNNHLMDNPSGIRFNATSNSNITNNYIYSSGFDGILLYYASNNVIVNNVIIESGNGIYLASSCNNNTLTDNTVLESHFGIWISSSEHNTLIENNASENYDGFYIAGYDNILSRNIALSNTNVGILIEGGRNNTFTENLATNNLEGISLRLSKNNTVNHNNASFNNEQGIIVKRSEYNMFNSNVASSNKGNGIVLDNDNYNNTLENNTALKNDDNGIFIVGSHNSTISNNTAASNALVGIHLLGSNDNYLSQNIAKLNNKDGIYIEYSSGNVLNNNSVDSNMDRGVRLADSSNNILNSNIICNNSVFGIRLSNSDNNSIYNNYFNNTNNTEIAGTSKDNSWNITKTTGPNIIDGPFLGGNYWAEPDGTGFSQTCIDANNDGFCDTQFDLSVNDTDFLPLNLNPAIDIEKHINGVDADTPIGVALRENETVTWEYIVNNTGNVILTDITVTDNKFGAICSIEKLMPGQSSVCTVTGTVEYGPHANLGTVLGNYTGIEVELLLSDEDPANYFGANPSIDVEKYTNGFDMDVDFTPGVYIGDNVNWQYVITNTGNVTLSNIVLSDDMEGIIPCPVNSLAPGESMVCEWEGVVSEYGLYHNTVNVTGDFEGLVTSDEDTGVYYGTEADDGDWQPPAVPTASPLLTAGVLGMFTILLLRRK